MYLFFLWEVTYFKNCFMIKKRSNQLLKMSTLIWFLFPSSQLLRLSQESPTSPSHTLPQLQPLASTPDGQPQNLADIRRSLSPCHRAQLCRQDIQSCSSQTYSISPGFEPAGLTGHQLQSWSPDLPKGSAPSLAHLRGTSDPGNATAARTAVKLRSHWFKKTLHLVFLFLHHTTFRAVTVELSTCHSQSEDSQHRASTPLITQWGGEKPLNLAWLT